MAACLLQCTLFCITHTCALGHLSPAFNIQLHRYTPSRSPFSTYLREPAWKMSTIQLCSKKRQEGSRNKIVQRQTKFGECQILLRVPTALVDAPQAHTRSSIIYSHVWMWGTTSSWAPRGDLRHFSKEEKASWRASHLTIAHTPTYTCCCFEANRHLVK